MRAHRLTLYTLFVLLLLVMSSLSAFALRGYHTNRFLPAGGGDEILVGRLENDSDQVLYINSMASDTVLFPPESYYLIPTYGGGGGSCGASAVFEPHEVKSGILFVFGCFPHGDAVGTITFYGGDTPESQDVLFNMPINLTHRFLAFEPIPNPIPYSLKSGLGAVTGGLSSFYDGSWSDIDTGTSITGFDLDLPEPSYIYWKVPNSYNLLDVWSHLNSGQPLLTVYAPPYTLAFSTQIALKGGFFQDDIGLSDPTPISFRPLADFVTASWGFGENWAGQLGLNYSSDDPIVSPLYGPFSTQMRSIAAGEYFSAMLLDNGTVVTWGANSHGQLGDGTTEWRNYPAVVPGLTDVVAIACGNAHMLAIKSNGTLWTWGANYYGQCGINSPNDAILSPVQVVGIYDGVSIAAGEGQSLLVRSDGSVWAWGSNAFGQLGDGTVTNRLVPVQVPDLTTASAVGTGYWHSFAIMQDGTVRGWGRNHTGQLGDGTQTERHSPVVIPGIEGIIKIDGGAEHTIALASDGRAWGWGINSSGQVGDGTSFARFTPTRVALDDIFDIAAGHVHSLAVRKDGTAWAWGSNHFGQLGLGFRESNFHSPVRSQYQSGAVYIAAGANHSLVQRANFSLTGIIILEDCLDPKQLLMFEFRPANGSPAFTRNALPASDRMDSRYAHYACLDVPPGNYTVRVKGSKWLASSFQVFIPSDYRNGAVTAPSVLLRAGDANNDNSVDVFDLDVLIRTFNLCLGDAGYDARADFNCDDCTDVFDLDIIIRNFNIEGAS